MKTNSISKLVSLALLSFALSACSTMSRTPASPDCANGTPSDVAECRANVVCPLNHFQLLQGANGMANGRQRGAALEAQRLCIEQNM